MKVYVLVPWLVALSATGQMIPNPDFEMAQDTNHLLPQAWQVDRNPSITITLDSVIAKSGRRALLIASVPDTARGGGGFSQNFPVHFSQPTLVHLRGFIKTDNPAGVGIWWNAWQDSKHRGFAHSDQQLKLRQTPEWQPLDLVLATPADINKYSRGLISRDGDGCGSMICGWRVFPVGQASRLHRRKPTCRKRWRW